MAPASIFDYDDLIFSSTTCVQTRMHTEHGTKIDAVPMQFSRDVSDILQLIHTAYDRECNSDETDTIRRTRFQDQEATIEKIGTRNGEAFIFRKAPGKPAPLVDIQGLHKQGRISIMENIKNKTGQSMGGIIITSSLPGQGNVDLAASIYTTSIETHGGVGLYISRNHIFQISGPTETSRGMTLPLMLPSEQESQDDVLVNALSAGPRIAFCDGITTPADVRLMMELASSGVIVIVAVNAGNIVAAIDLIVSKSATSYGSMQTSRDILATILRAVIHSKKPIGYEYFFLGNSQNNPGNLKVSEKIKNGHTPLLTQNINDHTKRILQNMPPIPLATV